MASPPELSVIVRARDEEASIGQCLELLDAQSLRAAAEVIVVDNGSRDRTAQIARRLGAHVVAIPRHGFSFGGALNAGAGAARGRILVSLSAHAYARDQEWLSRLAGALGDGVVACASGDVYGPDGERLSEPRRQDLSLARRRPEWGYSNAAGAFPAALWRARRFREDLPGAEDREWAWHWMAAGMRCLIDPALVVEHDHTHDPVAAIYRRARREAEGLAMFGALGPQAPGELAREWWSDARWYRSHLRARLSHRRAARLLGAYAGRRRGTRRRPAGRGAGRAAPTA